MCLGWLILFITFIRVYEYCCFRCVLVSLAFIVCISCLRKLSFCLAYEIFNVLDFQVLGLIDLVEVTSNIWNLDVTSRNLVLILLIVIFNVYVFCVSIFIFLLTQYKMMQYFHNKIIFFTIPYIFLYLDYDSYFCFNYVFVFHYLDCFCFEYSFYYCFKYCFGYYFDYFFHC